MTPDDPRTFEAPAPGTLIAERYRVLGPLARGGMGCLVRAEHLLLKTVVAIKLVLPERGDRGHQRLIREARAAQALSCEEVVRVFDVGIHDGAPFIVMELLVGSDLWTRVRRQGVLDVEDAVDGILEACVAVSEAHGCGIIHRDIKPANLFAARIGNRELVKVLDFGISRVPEPMADDCEKTTDETVLGTPYYASPEQLRNPTRIDERADVWSLAVSLYFLLTGEHPFAGETAREVTAAIFSEPPRSLLDVRSDLPEAMWDVLACALAKRPEDRTPSVAAFAARLAAFASERGARALAKVQEDGDSIPAPASVVPPPSVMTTEDGLASTQPSISWSPPTSRRRVAAGLAVLSLAVLLWQLRAGPSAIPGTATSGHAAAASAAPAADSPASSGGAREPGPATPSAAASTTPPTPSASPAEPVEPIAVRPPNSPPFGARPPVAPAVTNEGSASTSATANPSEPSASSREAQGRPLDIDGVPIVN